MKSMQFRWSDIDSGQERVSQRLEINERKERKVTRERERTKE